MFQFQWKFPKKQETKLARREPQIHGAQWTYTITRSSLKERKMSDQRNYWTASKVVLTEVHKPLAPFQGI